eukprot:scaffold155_cov347-Pavlova_lutheri.AAC.30
MSQTQWDVSFQHFDPTFNGVHAVLGGSHLLEHAARSRQCRRNRAFRRLGVGKVRPDALVCRTHGHHFFLDLADVHTLDAGIVRKHLEKRVSHAAVRKRIRFARHRSTRSTRSTHQVKKTPLEAGPGATNPRRSGSKGRENGFEPGRRKEDPRCTPGRTRPSWTFGGWGHVSM